MCWRLISNSYHKLNLKTRRCTGSSSILYSVYISAVGVHPRNNRTITTHCVPLQTRPCLLTVSDTGHIRCMAVHPQCHRRWLRKDAVTDTPRHTSSEKISPQLFGESKGQTKVSTRVQQRTIMRRALACISAVRRDQRLCYRTTNMIHDAQIVCISAVYVKALLYRRALTKSIETRRGRAASPADTSADCDGRWMPPNAYQHPL